MIIIFLSLLLDFAKFKISNDTTFCEVYWSEPYSFFQYVKKESRYEAHFDVDIFITNLNNRKQYPYSFPKVTYISSPGEAKNREMKAVDLIPLFLTSGSDYKITIAIVDSISKKIDSSSVLIRSPFWNGFTASDLQISHTLRTTEIKNKFTKNSYMLVPFPERKFDQKRYLLAYYLEFYNAMSDTIIVSVDIASKDKLIQHVSRDKYPNVGEGLVVAGGVNLLGIQEGQYKIVVSIIDGKNKLIRSKDFNMGGYAITQRQRISPELSGYASFIDYIATPQEISYFNVLSDSGKTVFLEKFWAKRDPNPATYNNEALEEFVKRIKYADENFSEIGKKGRYTDRGRIYIKYGPPDEVIERSLELSTHPYFIWYYTSSRQAEFIFVDINENGTYEQVYSSIKNEPYDPMWQQYLLPEDTRRTIKR